jgi:hypothetical protein
MLILIEVVAVGQQPVALCAGQEDHAAALRSVAPAFACSISCGVVRCQLIGSK